MRHQLALIENGVDNALLLELLSDLEYSHKRIKNYSYAIKKGPRGLEVINKEEAEDIIEAYGERDFLIYVK